MYKARITFVMLTLFLLIFPIVVFPVVADEIDITNGFYRIPYGNGIDDNGDGVVDDINESDVFHGGANISGSGNVIIDTWAPASSFTYPVGGIPRGVCLGGVFEELWNIQSSKNSTNQPAMVYPTQTCQYLTTDYDGGNMSFATDTNCINVLMFYVNISPQFIMNGASQLWYRSPLSWDNHTYQGTQHYLNIYDNENNLVYASPNSDASGITGFYSRIPDPKILVDRSGNFSASQMANMTQWYAPHEVRGGRSYWNRSYFQLNMNFKTGTRYRFEEYIKTQGNIPINNITLFMARQQDIAGDNETTTYIFWGTPYSRNIPVECSWGLVASIGKGRAGSELLLQSNPSYGLLNHPVIITNIFEGKTSIHNTKSIQIVLPIRTSMPLNITVSYRCWSGTGMQSWVGVLSLVGVTGTLVFTININDPDITQPNYYQLMFEITNFNTLGNAMTVSIYPAINPVSGQTETCMINYGLFDETELYYFAMDVQLNEETSVIGNINQGTNLPEYLLGAALIISSILLAFTLIGIPVSATIIAGTLTIGEFTALAGASIGLGTLGTLLIIHSLTGQGLQNFMSWAASGFLRVLQSIYEGIRWFIASVWDVGVAIANAVKYVGEQILKWGSIILDAILQIIWFIAFIVVLMVWGAFLTSMKYIAKGDVDGALRAMFKPIKKPLVYYERKGMQVARGTTKTQKWYRKVKKARAKRKVA